MLELLVVMLIIAIGYAILLPVLERGRRRGMMIKCASNLRQAGVAFQQFAHDHDSRFPMEVPVSAGGTLEFRPAPVVGAEFWEAFRHFQVLSNELMDPRVLICRLDSRQAAPRFDALRNIHLSFFAGLEATYKQPQSILAGDRNLLTTGNHSDVLALIQPEDEVFWSGDLHGFRGNLLLADGSVHDVRNASLRAMLTASGSNALVILPPANVAEPVLIGPTQGWYVAPTDASNSTSIAASMSKRSETNFTPPSASRPPTAVATVGRAQDLPAAGGLAREKPSVPVPVPSPASGASQAAFSADPGPTSPDSWIADLGQFLVGLGWRGTYLFLLLLLAVLIYLEIQRRRWSHKRARAAEADLPA